MCNTTWPTKLKVKEVHKSLENGQKEIVWAITAHGPNGFSRITEVDSKGEACAISEIAQTIMEETRSTANAACKWAKKIIEEEGY